VVSATSCRVWPSTGTGVPPLIAPGRGAEGDAVDRHAELVAARGRLAGSCPAVLAPSDSTTTRAGGTSSPACGVERADLLERGGDRVADGRAARPASRRRAGRCRRRTRGPVGDRRHEDRGRAGEADQADVELLGQVGDELVRGGLGGG
jgi:hypothetical protein